LGDFPEAVEGLFGGPEDRRPVSIPALHPTCRWKATLANGATIVGETRISRSRHRHPIHPSASAKVRPLPAALTAIAEADVDHPRTGLALHQHRAQPVGGWHRVRHTELARPEVLLRQSDVAARRDGRIPRQRSREGSAPPRRRQVLDYAVVNIPHHYQRPPENAMPGQAAMPVENDVDALLKMGLKVMAGNLSGSADKIRHDPDATAEVVLKLAKEGRRRKHA